MSADNISILIKRVSIQFDNLANKLLAPYDLTGSQIKVLKYLYRHEPASQTQRDLEHYFDMSNPTVTKLVQNLERNGFIERKANPDDARSKVMVLTEKSYQLEQELTQVTATIDQQLTEKLNEDDKVQLVQLLNKMI